MTISIFHDSIKNKYQLCIIQHNNWENEKTRKKHIVMKVFLVYFEKKKFSAWERIPENWINGFSTYFVAPWKKTFDILILNKLIWNGKNDKWWDEPLSISLSLGNFAGDKIQIINFSINFLSILKSLDLSDFLLSRWNWIPLTVKIFWLINYEVFALGSTNRSFLKAFVGCANFWDLFEYFRSWMNFVNFYGDLGKVFVRWYVF